MRRFLLVVFCGLTVGMLSSQSRAGQDVQTVKDELAHIAGVWQLVYAEADGKTVPCEQVRPVRVEIKGNSNSVYFGGKQVVQNVTFALDPRVAPRTTDETITDGPDQGKQIHGIYELQGDTLASCVAKIGQERPQKFSTMPGSGHTFRVFKRVRPDEDPKEKAVRDELIQFGGTWKFTSLDFSGTKAPDADFAANRLILQADRFLATDASETTAGYYRIDPTRVPKTIDIVFTSGALKGTRVHGSYELTDDTYKQCISTDDQPRPETFESKPGSSYAVVVLKREKP